MNPPAHPFVITQREWQKYQEQFSGLQPQAGFVTGAQAKNFFLQSQLPPILLGQIWSLADTDSDGKLDLNEFSIACKLINLKLRGVELPKRLPQSILESLRALNTQTVPAAAPIIAPTAAPIAANLPGAVPAIPGIVPGTLPGIVPHPVVPPMPANVMMTAIPTAIPATAGTATTFPMQQQIPGAMPSIIPGVMPPVMPGVMPTAMAGVMPQAIIPPPGMVPGTIPMAAVPPIANVNNTAAPTATAVGVSKILSPPSGDVKIPATPTPPQSNPPSRHMSISERAPSIESPNQSEWIVKAAEKRKYTQVFNTNDRMRTGYLTGNQARAILVQSKLPQKTLAEVWTLSDIDQDGRLSCDEFILAMFLCDKAIKKEPLPASLPPDWIPPSYRNVIKSRHGSISAAGSRVGSTTSSRHASISSQGTVDADPLAGLPQTSFEDKRKENFDKGQAELDRRRKLLQDQQRKEKEERERKEREEAEKREKARLEAERKQQEELERQLQKQRELELEKEEQRKRELEAKDAARKELEKQRQQEWEQSRIAEMNTQKEREQERVLKQKAHNTQLNIELSTINEKIKELSQKICDTRASVTNVKSVIDGMRSQRDTCTSEMSQNKARIKEQNAKLLQLSQERAQVEAKSKVADSSHAANKQLIIAQLKDKVENSKKEIEQKKEDINSNDAQVAEEKAELSAILKDCEKLYLDYDSHRTQVLEIKYNKKNENVSAAAAAWDTTATSAWGNDTEDTDQYTLSNDTTASIPASSTADTSGPAPEGFVKYRAVYEFTARNTDEITFVPGDVIFVPLEQNAEPGWLAGEINGHTGWFPETYVEKMEDEYTAEIVAAAEPIATTAPALAQDEYNNDNSQTISSEAESVTAYNGDIEYYIAAYPYQSAEAGDLNFNAGEMVMVIKKEGEWWTGTIGNRTGMFPSNYVQKADVGNVGATAIEEEAFDKQAANNVNGNAQTTNAYDAVIKQDTQSSPLPNTAASHITSDETRTNEELDIEVSQINTQPKSQTEPAESYSRPMSRTSTMTPGMRAKRSEIAQVIAPYEATSSEQLSLTRGHLIMIRKKTETGWWEGELQAKGRRRQIGWFPATYVKVLQGGRNSGRNTPVSGSRIEMTEQILDKVIALYPYKAQNDDELSFDKDDIISVLGRDEPEWWRGELNGLTGLFPSNYVGPFVTSGKRVMK